MFSSQTSRSLRPLISRCFKNFEGLSLEPQLRDFGFVTWTRRLVRTSPGWRTEQTSNAYVLLIPCEAHSAREAIFHRFKKGAATAAPATSSLPTPTHEAREAAVAALERRRAVIEGRMPTAELGVAARKDERSDAQ
jgi:hypothetical protein